MDALAEGQGEENAGKETADVRQVSDSAHLPGAQQGARAADELNHDPEAQRHPGGDGCDEAEEEHVHIPLREEQQVSAQHPGNRAGCPEHGDIGKHGEGELGKGGSDTTDQVKDQILEMPHAVFDVVTKDAQVEHIAQQVQPAGVHEDGGEKGDALSDGVGDKPGGDKRPGDDETFPCQQLHEEHDDVQPDQADGDEGEGSP